jgi:hypothetical protein
VAFLRQVLQTPAVGRHQRDFGHGEKGFQEQQGNENQRNDGPISRFSVSGFRLSVSYLLN